MSASIFIEISVLMVVLLDCEALNHNKNAAKGTSVGKTPSNRAVEIHDGQGYDSGHHGVQAAQWHQLRGLLSDGWSLCGPVQGVGRTEALYRS